MNQRKPIIGMIRVQRDHNGTQLSAVIPGHAGHVVGRTSTAAALRALADAIEASEARTGSAALRVGEA